jgi:AraC-like DNA-binding protein
LGTRVCTDDGRQNQSKQYDPRCLAAFHFLPLPVICFLLLHPLDVPEHSWNERLCDRTFSEPLEGLHVVEDRPTPQPVVAQPADDPEMERMRRDLDERFADAWSMTRLARTVGVTPQHFSRRFKRYSGCSPMTYLKSRRLHAAMTELRTADAPIIQIAYRSEP